MGIFSFHISRLRRTVRIFTCLIGILSLPAQAVLEIKISGSVSAAIPIAIAPFTLNNGADPSSAVVGQVIEQDLQRSGLFSVLPAADHPQKLTYNTAISYPLWRSELGADYVVLGAVQKTGSGGATGYMVSVQLADVYKGSVMAAYQVATDRNGIRAAGHQIANFLYEKLTGKKGMFASQLAWVQVSGVGKARTYRLMMADSDGFDPKALVTANYPLLSPSFSRDGKQLAYAVIQNGQSAIYVQNIMTGAARLVSRRPGLNASPSWSPDGTHLLATLSFEGNPNIYRLGLDGSIARLTDHAAIDTEARYSPDGASIVFTSDRSGRPQIYRMSSGGGAAQRLTFVGTSNTSASFSPDGKYLVMVQENKGYHVALYTLGSGQVRLLSRGRDDQKPTFSPNSLAVLYANDSGLNTVTIDGSAYSSLLSTGGVREPAWVGVQ